jgi:hypothetical protein
MEVYIRLHPSILFDDEFAYPIMSSLSCAFRLPQDADTCMVDVLWLQPTDSTSERSSDFITLASISHNEADTDHTESCHVQAFPLPLPFEKPMPSSIT